MGGISNGVEIRETSIRIKFTFEGKRHSETITLNGAPMKPTAPNIRHAHRLAVEIKTRIRHGTFSMIEMFPDSGPIGHAATLGPQLDLWLGLQTALKGSTLKGYRIAAAWWKSQIGHKPLRALVHSDILTALATEPTWSGKTRNNKVSVLRQALDLALRDRLMTTDPLAGLEAAEHQKKPPDPFTLEEAELILADMRRRHDPQIVNYFECKFFTGTRTSESMGVRWGSIDFRLNHMAVTEGIVLGEHVESTKTGVGRIVQLSSRAMAAIKAQKQHTFLADKGGWVFLDPRSGERWADDWTPREMYWRPTLTRLGIRYRSPYQTRHTYATMMLMAGMTPAFCATQLGHSTEMFFRTYSKWIHGGRNDVEMNRLESFLGTLSPECPRLEGNGRENQ